MAAAGAATAGMASMQLSALATQVESVHQSLSQRVAGLNQHLTSMVSQFERQLNKLDGRLSRVEARQVMMFAWLCMLSIATGVDFVSEFALAAI